MTFLMGYVYLRMEALHVKSPAFHFDWSSEIGDLRSYNFMSGRSSLHITTLPSLSTIGTVVVEICF